MNTKHAVLFLLGAAVVAGALIYGFGSWRHRGLAGESSNLPTSTATGRQIVVLVDYSASMVPDELSYVRQYIEKRILPRIHPGDELVIAKIGNNPYSGFQVLLDEKFPAVADAPHGIRSLLENTGEAAADCEHRYRAFLREVGHPATAGDERAGVYAATWKALDKPATDENTCLIQTVAVAAQDIFSKSAGAKALVLFSDGLLSCGGTDFERRPPSRQETAEILRKLGNLPQLPGVQVYLICRVGAREASGVRDTERVYGFWKAFFAGTHPLSFQIGPFVRFDFESPLTRKAETAACGF